MKLKKKFNLKTTKNNLSKQNYEFEKVTSHDNDKKYFRNNIICGFFLSTIPFDFTFTIKIKA
jgi:hypothetical protein